MQENALDVTIPNKNLRLIIQCGCGIALFCVHWDQVFFHEKLKKGGSRKTRLGQTAPSCYCQALLVSLWSLARSLFAHAQTHSHTHPSNPRSKSKHTLSITVRGESAHASESTIKYLSRSSSDFDSVLMLLTALACCNTYWSKHGQSNIVVLLNACERTQKNTERTI